jgi:tetratricopeptide (TPR) repeat protein
MRSPVSGETDLTQLLLEGRVAVLCGAGISRNSGLPVANDLVTSFLDALNARPEERDAVLGAQLPFELFMQSLDECRSVRPVIQTLGRGRPNTNHLFLAQLFAAGRVSDLFTTNFDLLIEAALSAVTPSTDYVLLDDDRLFQGEGWKAGRRRLVKLHGSLAKYDDLAFTLRQVAKRQLAEWRGHALDYLFRDGPHAAVLVLGYSGSDRFDITPRLQSYKQLQKTVFVFEHGSVRPPESLAAKPQPNPFQAFPGVRLFGDTDAFVKRAWQAVLSAAYKLERFAADEVWKTSIADWARSAVGVGEREAILGHLMFAAGRPALGLDRVTGTANATGPLAESLALMNRGAGLGAAGRYSEAAAVLEHARRSAAPLGNTALMGQILTNLAHARFAQGDAHGALQHCLSATALFAGTTTRELAAVVDTMASCFDRLGRHADALHFGTIAADMMRDLGEQAFLGVATGNLALYLEGADRLTDALSMHRQAFETSTSIDSASVARHAGNIVRLATQLGDQTVADEFRQYLLDARPEESIDDLAIRIHNQANDLTRSGKWHESLPLYGEAIELTKTTGNRAGLALQHYNRGLCHYELEHLQDAADDFVEAAEVAQEIDHVEMVVNATAMSAKVLLDVGALGEALTHLERALLLMRETGISGQYDQKEIESLVERMRRDPKVRRV